MSPVRSESSRDAVALAEATIKFVELEHLQLEAAGQQAAAGLAHSNKVAELEQKLEVMESQLDLAARKHEATVREHSDTVSELHADLGLALNQLTQQQQISDQQWSAEATVAQLELRLSESAQLLTQQVVQQHAIEHRDSARIAELESLEEQRITMIAELERQLGDALQQLQDQDD